MNFFKLKDRLVSRIRSVPAVGTDLNDTKSLEYENNQLKERIRELESMVMEASSDEMTEEKGTRRHRNAVNKMKVENRNLKRDLLFNKARVRYFNKKMNMMEPERERFSFKMSYENKENNTSQARFLTYSKDEIRIVTKRRYSVTGTVSTKSALCMERLHDRLKMERQKKQIRLLERKMEMMEEKFAKK